MKLLDTNGHSVKKANGQEKSLIREVARTWKDGGGDAMGFHWCQERIRQEILRIERESQQKSASSEPQPGKP